MAIRDDLIDLVDGLRRDVVDEAFGLRLDTVAIRTVEWTGTEIGSGTKAVTDVTLDPVPKVSRPSPKLRASEPGKYEDGDVIVDKISATYTRTQLAGSGQVETIWLLNGEPYTVEGIDELYLAWRVHLRRARNR